MSEERMPLYERNVRRLAQGEQLHDPAESVRMFVAQYDRRGVELAEAASFAHGALLERRHAAVAGGDLIEEKWTGRILRAIDTDWSTR